MKTGETIGSELTYLPSKAHFYDIGYADGKGFFVTNPPVRETTTFPQLTPVNGQYYKHLPDAEKAREELEN